MAGGIGRTHGDAGLSGTKTFIFGAGYSARAFARANADFGTFAGTTRRTEKFAALRDAGVSPLAFEGALTPAIEAELAQTTHLVVSVAPDEAGDPVLRAAGDAIGAKMPMLEWIGYLSTVGVYGDRDGGWVDETGECRPVSRRSRSRLEAERDWQALAGQAGLPLAILRLSGIYGPGRNAFVNLANGTARRLVKPGQVFNRIHRDDIAGALRHLAERRQGGVFNVTDDMPSPPQEVVAYAASLMGVAPPPETDFATAQLSPMARSFYGENKRVANTALKETGYRLRFADYRAALEHMWAAGDWADGEARSPMKRS